MTRAEQLVTQLALQPHPEGGHYREQFRSRRMVRTDDGRSERWALTSILYLLRAGERSRWHRVASDEVWHFHEGAPLEVHLLDGRRAQHRVERLGPVAEDGTRPLVVVPAGVWQAVRPSGEYALCGCDVAPGFEFADFRLMADDPVAAQALRESHPALVDLL